jgi:sporulation protein YlmC with PRC-barrel domain
MNKTLNFLIMISLSFGLLAASAHAAAPMATGYERQYQFSEIVRTYVMNPQGQFLGRISDIAFDSEGHVSFLILARPWMLGIYGKPVAVPFEAFSYDDKNKHLVLSVDYEKIRDAPVFNKEDLTDRKRAADAYRYFGQQPYWTEQGIEKQK